MWVPQACSLQAGNPLSAQVGRLGPALLTARLPGDPAGPEVKGQQQILVVARALTATSTPPAQPGMGGALQACQPQLSQLMWPSTPGPQPSL